MRQAKIFGFVSSGVICLLLLAEGCEQEWERTRAIESVSRYEQSGNIEQLENLTRSRDGELSDSAQVASSRLIKRLVMNNKIKSVNLYYWVFKPAPPGVMPSFISGLPPTKPVSTTSPSYVRLMQLVRGENLLTNDPNGVVLKVRVVKTIADPRIADFHPENSFEQGELLGYLMSLGTKCEFSIIVGKYQTMTTAKEWLPKEFIEKANDLFGVEPEKQRPEAAKVKVEKVIEPEVKKEKAVETRVEPKETIKTEAKPEKQGPTIQLALKFTPDDLTTYKVVTEVEKSVKWEGPLPDKASAFKGGATGSRVEITFAQRIQGVDDKGNAVAQITVKGLKYLGRVKDNVVADFDSSREKDANNPLFKLVGQSYTIEISPDGQVLRVIDVSGAQAAVAGSSSASKTASVLLTPDVVKERHTIPALPAADKNRLRTGDNWSSIKAFSFDMMGSKSYEKIYTLKEIKEVNNKQIAVAEMKAIPSSEMAEELHKEHPSFWLPGFDNTEAYSGELALDLTAGKVQEYFEKLRTEWVMVDPKPEPNKEPAALRMTAARLYSIERIE